MPQKWALLCGGDYYAEANASQKNNQSRKRPKNLEGCANDVDAMKSLLTTFGVPERNIRILTATAPSGSEIEEEQRKRWPTKKNIRRELDKIQKEAESDSENSDRLLYFHYSGHGTFLEDDDGRDDFRGTALVMTDVACGGPYLTGRRLGIWIKRLVKQSGFRVTVVLDSCFSGDGFRDESDTESDPTFEPRNCPPEIDAETMEERTVERGRGPNTHAEQVQAFVDEEREMSDGYEEEAEDDWDDGDEDEIMSICGHEESKDSSASDEEEDEMLILDNGEEGEPLSSHIEKGTKAVTSKKSKEGTAISHDEKITITNKVQEEQGMTVSTGNGEEEDMATTDEEDAMMSDEEKEASNGERDGMPMRKCWFMDPKGCVVITACSRVQTAGEKKFKEKKQGILTHFLIETVLKLQTEKERRPSYACIIDALRGKTLHRQAPELYGEGIFEYFGLEKCVQAESCKARRVDNRVHIDVGSAQGVEAGSVYNIFLDNPTRVKRVTVESVASFTSSTAPCLSIDIMESWPESEVRRATSRQWALPETLQIHYSEDVPDRNSLNTMLVTRYGLKVKDGETQDEDMDVRLDKKKGIFKVFQKGATIKGLPEVSVNDPEWQKKLAAIMSHVARYQALHVFYSSFSHSKLPKDRFKVLHNVQEVTEGEEVTIGFRYKGPLSYLWVSMFNFTPTWAIKKLYPSCGTTAKGLPVIDGEAEIQHVMKMTIPPRRRHENQESFDDYFIYFISTSPRNIVPSWGGICLPPLKATDGPKGLVWVAPAVTKPEDEEDERCGEIQNKSTAKTDSKPQSPVWATVVCSVRTKRLQQTASK